jgi:hypothetical protein
MTDYAVVKELFGLTQPKGLPETGIAQMRAVCGVLPEALGTWYRELGGEEAVNQTQNNLLLPEQLSWCRSPDHFFIYLENQGVCGWAIRREDMDRADPPVWVSFQESVPDRGGVMISRWPLWERESARVSDFLVGMAHLHAAFALPCGDSTMYSIGEDAAARIRARYRQKCPPFGHWVDGGIEFYGLYENDSIVMMRNAGDYDLFYASGNEARFAELDAFLSPLGEAY